MRMIKSSDNLHQQEIPPHEAAYSTHRRERSHEAVTMALYISLSLLAVLAALPSSFEPGAFENPAVTIFLTSIGLLLAHVVAFRLSTRLVHGGRLPEEQLQLLAAQITGGLVVTLLAVIPVLIFGGPDGVRLAGWLPLALVALVGYMAARAVPLSRTRALFYVAIVVVVVVGVLWIKNLVHH